MKVLDPATMSIRHLCKTELQHMSQEGTFARHHASPDGSLLFALVSMMSKFFYAETQSIEGLNSIVKLMGRRCPNITLELLSSRLGIKRLIGQADGAIGCRKKFSAVKALAEREVSELASFSGQTLAVLADGDRWSSAPAISFPLVPHAAPLADSAVGAVQHDALQTGEVIALLDRGLIPESAMSSNLIIWAKSYNLGWKWGTGGGRGKGKKASTSKVKQLHSLEGLGIIIMPTPDMQETCYYFAADYFSHSVSFSRLLTCRQCVQGSDQYQDCVKWHHDRSAYADTIESTLLFAKYFEACHVRKQTFAVRAAFLKPVMCQQLFAKPGWLSVASLMECSVHLFDMTDAIMKGALCPRVRRSKNTTKTSAKAKGKAKAKAAAAHMVDVAVADADDERAAEADEAAEAEAEADAAYIHEARHEILDTSGSEDGETEAQQDPAEEGDEGVNAHAATQTTAELRASVQAGQQLPSMDQISQATRQVANAGCTAPVPEAEEEALLLLVRQRNAQAQAKAKGSASQKQLVLEGVGDASPGLQTQANLHRLDSAASDSHDSDAESCPDESDALFSATTCELSGSGNDASTSAARRSWLSGILRTLRALRAVHDLQRDKDLGSERSISLVSMKPGKVNGCACVRCRWGSPVDAPEAMFVHWLNNSKSHGLLGRKARQVNIDGGNKVLYSAADVTMSKTGIQSGMGFPELNCDADHCDILIPFLNASMRKVKKTSPDRDEVDSSCLIFMEFCVAALFTMSGIDHDEDCRAGLGLERCRHA